MEGFAPNLAWPALALMQYCNLRPEAAGGQWRVATSALVRGRQIPVGRRARAGTDPKRTYTDLRVPPVAPHAYIHTWRRQAWTAAHDRASALRMISNSKCSKYLMQEAEADGWSTGQVMGHGKARKVPKAEIL